MASTNMTEIDSNVLDQAYEQQRTKRKTNKKRARLAAIPFIMGTATIMGIIGVVGVHALFPGVTTGWLIAMFVSTLLLDAMVYTGNVRSSFITTFVRGTINELNIYVLLRELKKASTNENILTLEINQACKEIAQDVAREFDETEDDYQQKAKIILERRVTAFDKKLEKALGNDKKLRKLWLSTQKEMLEIEFAVEHPHNRLHQKKLLRAKLKELKKSVKTYDKTSLLIGLAAALETTKYYKRLQSSASIDKTKEIATYQSKVESLSNDGLEKEIIQFRTELLKDKLAKRFPGETLTQEKELHKKQKHIRNSVNKIVNDQELLFNYIAHLEGKTITKPIYNKADGHTDKVLLQQATILLHNKLITTQTFNTNLSKPTLAFMSNADEDTLKEKIKELKKQSIQNNIQETHQKEKKDKISEAQEKITKKIIKNQIKKWDVFKKEKANGFIESYRKEGLSKRAARKQVEKDWKVSLPDYIQQWQKTDDVFLQFGAALETVKITTCRDELYVKSKLSILGTLFGIGGGAGFSSIAFTSVGTLLLITSLSVFWIGIISLAAAVTLGFTYGMMLYKNINAAIKKNIFKRTIDKLGFINENWNDLLFSEKCTHVIACLLKLIPITLLASLALIAIILTAGELLETSTQVLNVGLDLLTKIGPAVSQAINVLGPVLQAIKGIIIFLLMLPPEIIFTLTHAVGSINRIGKGIKYTYNWLRSDDTKFEDIWNEIKQNPIKIISFSVLGVFIGAALMLHQLSESAALVGQGAVSLAGWPGKMYRGIVAFFHVKNPVRLAVAASTVTETLEHADFVPKALGKIHGTASDALCSVKSKAPIIWTAKAQKKMQGETPQPPTPFTEKIKEAGKQVLNGICPHERRVKQR